MKSQVFSLLFLILIFISCSKKHENVEVVIVNNTKYNINELTLKGRLSEYTFTVLSGEESEVIPIDFKENDFSTANCVWYNVVSFSDSITICKDRSISSCLPMEDFEMTGVNKLLLTCPNPGSDCEKYSFDLRIK